MQNKTALKITSFSESKSGLKIRNVFTLFIIKPKQLFILVAVNEDSFNSVSTVGQEMENQKMSFTHMIELTVSQQISVKHGGHLMIDLLCKLNQFISIRFI